MPGDPAGLLRRLRDEQAHRAAVPLGQPGPALRAGQAVADLFADQPGGVRPPDRPAEVHVVADEPQLQVEHLLLVGRAGRADRHAVGAARRSARRGAVRPGAGGDHGERLQAVPEQGLDAGDVQARPDHAGRRVRAPGRADPGQVIAPLGEQLVGRRRDVLARAAAGPG